MGRDEGGGGKGRGTTVGKPMNKSAANVQITAEQLLIEARDRTEQEPHRQRSKLHDKEELMEYRSTKRGEFEKLIQRNKVLMSNWTKYARWEENQAEFVRARSIFERALDAIPANHSLYQKYAEMEMKAENINSARNIWRRAVTILPRVDGLWMKWALMEETIGDVAMCRKVFQDWMGWKPKSHGWHLFAKFEIRFKEIEKARDVIRQMVTYFNDEPSWLYFARFEEKYGKPALARRIYEEGLDALGTECTDKIFIAFAKFEERQKEFERSRGIYKIALDRISKDKAPDLYATYVEFEKMYGERQGIEDALISRRRFEYEESIKAMPYNYDVWFNYVRMEESQNNPELVRDLYERAIAVKPMNEKQYWSRYVYLWLMYAQYEELDMEDKGKADKVFQAMLRAIPHKMFSFSKAWIAYAEFLLRCNRLDDMRKVMGNGLGANPRPKMYRWYVELEVTLGNIERVRGLYTSWLKAVPSDGRVWARFAEFELTLNETKRARELFELGVSQEVLDQPELLWKKYINTEIKLKNYTRASELYKTLAGKTKHVKVYLAWANMERETVKSIDAARAVYEEADITLSADAESSEEHNFLLEQWKAFEEAHGTPAMADNVDVKLHPEKAKKKSSKLMERAQAWKKRKTQE
eukprot:TRINITY_DN9825_c0_g1_i1.p1 TRINITY_DN9825_c0_g1~~TRINITY_DN9825_c0_g1_i1.p1  ORF type:complete len:641 (+),score=134.04 TRINITY_DN9825_c0_g1_i1:188-2110(+)